MQQYIMNITPLIRCSKIKGCISPKLENLYNSNVSITRKISVSPWSFELWRLHEHSLFSETNHNDRFLLFYIEDEEQDLGYIFLIFAQTNSSKRGSRFFYAPWISFQSNHEELVPWKVIGAFGNYFLKHDAFSQKKTNNRKTPKWPLFKNLYSMVMAPMLDPS